MYKLISTAVFSIFLLLPNKLEAQIIFALSKDSAYYISTQSTCNALRVIDIRKNKDNLGHFRSKMFDKREPFLSEMPLNTFLPEYFCRIGACNQGSIDELVLVLYHFEVEDSPNGDNICTFYIDGDFYRGSKGQYAFLGQIDSIYEMLSGRKPDKTLMKAASQKLSNLFSYFSASAPVDNVPYTESGLTERRQREHLKYPIYSATNYKKGIYYTAEQFINVQPQDTSFVEEVYYTGDTRRVRYHYLNSKGKKGKHIDENSFFAVYNGSKWMVGLNGHCEPMTFADGEIYIEKRFRGIKSVSRSVVNAGILFGLTGALIAGSVYGWHDERKGWSLYKAKFDPETKSFIPVRRID